MTSLRASKPGTFSTDTTDDCPKCGGPLAWRQKNPYPALQHALFGLSFVLFLVFIDKLNAYRPVVWAWCGIQAFLGYLLVRARIKARKRFLICIRCDHTLE